MSNPNKNIDTHSTDHKDVKSDSTSVILYRFSEQGKGNWRIQDDVVMGGAPTASSRSQPKIRRISLVAFL